MTFGSKKVRGTFLPRAWKQVSEEGPVTHRVRFRCLTPATMTRFEKAWKSAFQTRQRLRQEIR